MPSTRGMRASNEVSEMFMGASPRVHARCVPVHVPYVQNRRTTKRACSESAPAPVGFLIFTAGRTDCRCCLRNRADLFDSEGLSEQRLLDIGGCALDVGCV